MLGEDHCPYQYNSSSQSLVALVTKERPELPCPEALGRSSSSCASVCALLDSVLESWRGVQTPHSLLRLDASVPVLLGASAFTSLADLVLSSGTHWEESQR